MRWVECQGQEGDFHMPAPGTKDQNSTASIMIMWHEKKVDVQKKRGLSGKA